jgi:hypothetical protein
VTLQNSMFKQTALEEARSARIVQKRRKASSLALQEQVKRAVRLLNLELMLHWLRVRFLGLQAALAWLCARGEVCAVRTDGDLWFVLAVRGGA